MDINNDYKQEVFIKIGKLLQNTREEKKISLEDVSNELKIRKTQLESIENGLGENTIQGEYFLYNFIKKYSQYLNIWNDVYTILNDSNILSLNLSNETNLDKNNELEKYNKNIFLDKKYFYIYKIIITILITLILIIGLIFWQKKSKETNSNKNLERITNTDNQLKTPNYPKIENNTKIITIPLEREEKNFNNLKNNLNFQEQLLKKSPDELTINIKYNSLLIVKDFTGKEFINKIVPGGSTFSFLGTPPYSVIIGRFKGTTIYKGKYKININSDNYPNNKPADFIIN